MKTLKDIQNYTVQMMALHSLIEDGWSFEWNRRAKSVGLCNGTKKVISLSKINTPHRDAESIKNTILHEIAHAIVGVGNDHNHIWRSKFTEIGGDGEKRASDMTGSMVGIKWVLKGPDGTIYKHYYRHPNRSTFAAVDRMYPQHRPELMGQLCFERIA